MQNPIPNLRQDSIISKKPGYFSEKLKTLMSSNYHRVYIVLLKFCIHFLFNNGYKRVEIVNDLSPHYLRPYPSSSTFQRLKPRSATIILESIQLELPLL